MQVSCKQGTEETLYQHYIRMKCLYLGYSAVCLSGLSGLSVVPNGTFFLELSLYWNYAVLLFSLCVYTSRGLHAVSMLSINMVSTGIKVTSSMSESSTQL